MKYMYLGLLTVQVMLRHLNVRALRVYPHLQRCRESGQGGRGTGRKQGAKRQQGQQRAGRQQGRRAADSRQQHQQEPHLENVVDHVCLLLAAHVH